MEVTHQELPEEGSFQIRNPKRKRNLWSFSDQQEVKRPKPTPASSLTKSSKPKEDQPSTQRRSPRLQAKQKERENSSSPCPSKETVSGRGRRTRALPDNVAEVTSLSVCGVSSSPETPDKRGSRAAVSKPKRNRSLGARPSRRPTSPTRRGVGALSRPSCSVASIDATANGDTSNDTGSKYSCVASRTRLSCAKSADRELSPVTQSGSRGRRKKSPLKKLSDSVGEQSRGRAATVKDIPQQSLAGSKSGIVPGIRDGSTSTGIETPSLRKRRPVRTSSASSSVAGRSPAKRRRTDSNSTRTESGTSSQRGKCKEEVDLPAPVAPKGRGRAKSKDSPESVAKGKAKAASNSNTLPKKKGSRSKLQPSSREASQSSSARTQSRGRTQEKGSSTKGKGRARGNPSKGKGKAREAEGISLPPFAEFTRLAMASGEEAEGISLPPFAEFARLAMASGEEAEGISLPPFAEFARLTMASRDSDQTVPSGLGGSEGHSPGGDGNGGRGSGGEGSEEKPFDPLASLDEESKRLQAMLEARGLPPHLLGALGSRMGSLLQKTMGSSLSSSNMSRAQQLLSGIEAINDESLQLQSCIELGQVLVMGNEDTLSGFPVKQAVPALVNLLSMEHNFDMMLNTCRALTYMMEALPRSTVVVASAIPLLVEKLQVIQCMDVAEQALSALELLSRRHSKAILQSGGLNACLLYLDFFSIATQRCALSVAANCCQSVTEEDFSIVADAIPVLSNRLQHQDNRSVESCCLCFSRLVDNFTNNPTILQEIASQGLLPNLQQLLVISPPVISPTTFVAVLRMLSTLCHSCPLLALEMLKLGVADTLRYLLVGSGEITLENIELMSRSPSEVYEILSLAGELMPPLPKDGIFEVEEIMNSRRHTPTTVQWQWQDNDGVWRPYSRIENRVIEATHQVHEEECSITIMGSAYIVDLGAMQQINEDTGTMRAVRRTLVDPAGGAGPADKDSKQSQEEDTRSLALISDPALGSAFVCSLFAVLYEVFNSMAGPAVRNKCLHTILRMLYHAQAPVLTDVLKDISVSSHIATMLKSQDYRTVVGALQMAHILMQKLPSIFSVYFHREGVMHHMEHLRDVPLKVLTTPKQDVGTPPAPPPSNAAQTPNSTRKRLSDIFRKGRRHFRKSLSRSRSEEEARHGQAPPLNPASHHQGATTIATATTTEGHPPMPGRSVSLGTGIGGGRPSSGGASGSRPLSRGGGRTPNREGSEEMTAKERIQQWIQRQSREFTEQWCSSVESNPALDVVKRLSESAEELEYQSASCLPALSAICTILMDPTSNVSAFELMHCNLHVKLMSFLSVDSPDCAVPLNTRLRQFLHVFMGLPAQDSHLATWTPPLSVGLVPLLQRLHGCVNQLEQLPVKVHDLPGRRGSQAMRFFNTHQIKCLLERHPSAAQTSQWKGGPLRIDPLATVQTLERYMVVRGFGRPDLAKRFEDLDMSEDSEVEDAVLQGLPLLNSDNHCIEFLINDHVLPYHLTVFQAIKQYAVGGGYDGEEETLPLGRPEIWIRSHTIHYRALSSDSSKGAGPSRGLSASLPVTPLSDNSFGLHKGSWGTGGSARKRGVSSKLVSVPIGLPPRVTRSSSREKPSPRTPTGTPVIPHTVTPHANSAPSFQEHLTSSPPKEKEQVRLSPLHQALQQCTATELIPDDDPALPVIKLLKVLYALNSHWTDLYPGLAGNPIVPLSEFINSKLTAKATRQVQDPLNVMTGNFPPWLRDLARSCSFLFPFECRQMLFYLTSFDRDRAIARLQEQQPELSSSESSQTVTPRFDKKKQCVSRANLLEQAEKVMNDLASNRALLEIHYEDEVGTGLGPTLEFYALVSRELQQADLGLWRGDPCPLPGASPGTPQYIQSPVGLFPAPLGPRTRFSHVEEVCSKFRFLGKFMAKAIMDSRMLDLPFSEAFYMWMLGLESTFTAQDLQHVDPMIARSFAQLASVAVKKHALESDPLLTGKALAVGVESLTLEGGGSIEDLDLDFTLPGYPDINLIPGGKETPVSIHNLDEYLKLVVDWTLVRGVRRQMEAFKDGFNSVFPLSNLLGFYPAEMDLLLCGAHHQKWDIKELMECCRPDHGYSHDSRAVQFLFEVLSTYDTAEQRQFVQFVTGSPRLPVGGFKALSPPLTIVRKTVESSQNPNDFLPSVMTCVNYLKLPDYSSVEVMREKLYFALQEGSHSFHLS